MNDYYVYVYIDPRNFEEFYYGKGRGSRKEAHLEDESDTPKVRRIRDIHSAGVKPIIRVIASGLSEHDALMIEATLLWKLGKYTTNLVAGHFTGNFRPHNTLHRELSGFDFSIGLYYFNIGEGTHRNWHDCRRLGFVAAGQGEVWRDSVCGLNPGDLLAAYVSKVGYVGVARVVASARPVREIIINGRPLMLECPSMADNAESDSKCEYVALVLWERAVDKNDALKVTKSSKLFSSPSVRASLDNQQATITALESHFDLKFTDLLR